MIGNHRCIEKVRIEFLTMNHLFVRSRRCSANNVRLIVNIKVIIKEKERQNKDQRHHKSVLKICDYMSFTVLTKIQTNRRN